MGIVKCRGKCGSFFDLNDSVSAAAELCMCNSCFVYSAEATDRTLNFLLFWRHEPAIDGSVDETCLSQWYTAPFTVNGTLYRTAEHFMMASKAALFGDVEVQQLILETTDPSIAKKLGRQVTGFNELTWQHERFDIVVAASVAKFQQNPKLLNYIMNTSGRVLVEASPYDKIWGIGLYAHAVEATRPSQWRGLNLLGFALMAARSRLELMWSCPVVKQQ